MEPKSRAPSPVRREMLTLNTPLLDADAVAQALGVTRRHVQRLVSERRIPFLKVGRFVRFDPAELNVWLDRQRVEPVRSLPRDETAWR
jgi:excisionase family DNA binding protein